jgi:D-amino-acid dehydrogenase
VVNTTVIYQGYSVSIPIAPSFYGMLRATICDDSNHIYIAPLGTKEIRLSGFAEFAGFDKTLELIRGKALLRAALPYFPRDSLLVDQAKYWTGFRPVTPDDVPVIGRLTPYQNLFVNTGHGSKGWKLSCGSSSLLAKIVAGETLRNFEPNSFNPNRFDS